MTDCLYAAMFNYKQICMYGYWTKVPEFDKALDTSIRGLKSDLLRLLGIRELTDLSQALHLCLKL